MAYMYTMDCYSAIRENGIIPFAEKLMVLNNAMLNKISYKQKNKRLMFSLLCATYIHVLCTYTNTFTHTQRYTNTCGHTHTSYIYTNIETHM